MDNHNNNKEKRVNTLPGNDYLGALARSGLTSPQVCQALNITARTERNYKTRGCPVVVVKWLQALSSDLKHINTIWQHWHIHPDGYLYTDQLSHHTRFLPGELLAIFWDKARTNTLELKIKKLEDELAALRVDNEPVNVFSIKTGEPIKR